MIDYATYQQIQHLQPVEQLKRDLAHYLRPRLLILDELGYETSRAAHHRAVAEADRAVRSIR